MNSQNHCLLREQVTVKKEALAVCQAEVEEAAADLAEVVEMVLDHKDVVEEVVEDKVLEDPEAVEVTQEVDVPACF
jgi:ABC-type phosphonate transport system ATPase subunit